MSKMFKNLDTRIDRIQKAARNANAPRLKAEAQRREAEAVEAARLAVEAECKALQQRFENEAPKILLRKGILVGEYTKAFKATAWMLPQYLKFTVTGLREICVALMMLWGHGDDFFLTSEYKELEREAEASETKREEEEAAFCAVANKVITDLATDNIKTTLKSGKEIPVLWNYHATMKAIRAVAPTGFRGLRGVVLAQQIMQDRDIADRWSQFMAEDLKYWETREVEFRAKKGAERREARRAAHKPDPAHVGFQNNAQDWDTVTDADIEVFTDLHSEVEL